MEDKTTTAASSASKPYGCETCGGLGLIRRVNDEGYALYDKCRCLIAFEIRKGMRKSGLNDLIARCTFDAFQTPQIWQREAKEKALRFVNDHEGKWFYFGGQPGAGKTHLCTAIVGELLKRGCEARYMLWRDEMSRLRTVRFDRAEYARRMGKWKRTPVLYIDDLFKTDAPDRFEKDATFEILNARYNKKRFVTILSSEHTALDLTRIDEAVGSRVFERCREYGVKAPQGIENNWRVRGGES